MVITYRISECRGDALKAEITARAHITRKNRPSFKTNIFIKPKWFKIHNKNKEGAIIIPALGKCDIRERNEIKKADEALREFNERLETIIYIARGNREITKEWLTNTLNKTTGVPTSQITNDILNDIPNTSSPKSMESDDIVTLLDIYIDSKGLCDTTVRAYHSMIRVYLRFIEYMKQVKGCNLEPSVNSLSSTNIHLFQEYYQNEHHYQQKYPKLFEKIIKNIPLEISPKHVKNKIKARHNNATVKAMKNLKAFTTWLLKKKKLHYDPFDCVNIGRTHYPKPFMLTSEEINLVKGYDCGDDKRMELARDMFYCTCLLGTRLSDLRQLSWEQISEDNILEYLPRKTSHRGDIVYARIPVADDVLNVMKKYKTLSRSKIWPSTLSDCDYNLLIKELLTRCNLTRKVQKIIDGEEQWVPLNEAASSHTARKTCVNLANQFSKNTNVLEGMFGYAPGSKAIHRYINNDENQHLWDVMNHMTKQP